MLFLIPLTILFATVIAPPPRVVEMQESEKVVDQIVPAKFGDETGLTDEKENVKNQVGAPAEKVKIDVKQPEKVLAVDDLKPPDHLDAVKLEQDGMLNKDYKKEIFLGNHEEIEDDNYQVAESKLKDIFSKVDTDQDQKLSFSEIEIWITDKIQEHFDEALEENAHVFKHLDPDGNGMVDWKEYYVHFLLAKGHPIDKAMKHVEDYDEIDLNFDERDMLIRYKFKWTDADQDVDNKLTEKEFLAFRHPEQSEQALDNMLSTIINSLDKNDDGILVEEEFVTLPLGEVDDEEQEKLDKEWQAERSKEFRTQIDKDGDGKVTKLELKRYLDPRNPDQAKSDTKGLIDIVDVNKDGFLSWDEIIEHKDVFIQSKVVNVKRTLHDEF